MRPWTVMGKSMLMRPCVVPASSSAEKPFGRLRRMPPLWVSTSRPGAVPVIAGDVDGDAAVGRLAAQIAADVGERQPAVLCVELGRAAEVVDRNAAVVGVQRQHGVARHVDLEADAPALVAVPTCRARRRGRGRPRCRCARRRPAGARRRRWRRDASMRVRTSTSPRSQPRTRMPPLRPASMSSGLAPPMVSSRISQCVARSPLLLRSVQDMAAGPSGIAAAGLGRSRGHEGGGGDGGDKSCAKHQASSARLDGRGAAGVYSLADDDSARGVRLPRQCRACTDLEAR